MTTPYSAPIAISLGEPSGVGPDIILSLYAKREELGLPPFVVYGDVAMLRSRASRLGLEPDIAEADPSEAAAVFTDALPVAPVAPMPDTPGTIADSAAAAVIEIIRRATEDCLSGKCRALVTAPIHKAALYAAGFDHPGHTEFLASLCTREGATPSPVMMLASDDFRAVPLTIHTPLRDVPDLITTDLIVETTRIVAEDLRTRFGIVAPRIAIAGLNPHAGEDGTIGREEIDTIAPAIARMQLDGLDVAGPLSADTLFHPPHWRSYDAVIAMYHDQALIPIKTIAFDTGVNVTLGLPIIRTSPDHGTALDIAGTGRASHASMLAALRMADRMSGGA